MECTQHQSYEESALSAKSADSLSNILQKTCTARKSTAQDVCNVEDVEKQKHYTVFVIQPMEFIGRNKLGFLEGNIIKYVCRYQFKNKLQDLRKAKHYLEKLIEREESGTITL